jgi:transposase
MRKKASIYSEEFKKEALHLLASSGKKKSEIERDLGLSHGLLRKWELRYQINPQNDKLERSEVEQLKAELRQVKRENAILRQEREILKKTVSIFSADV